MLSRRWLINYLLITLIIIFTWIANKYPVGEGQKTRQEKITQLQPQDINQIKLETSDDIIRLEKKGSRWTITDPVKWYANNIAAERLTTLATLEASSKLPRDQIDLSTLGLSIPNAVIMLNDLRINFGDTNQIGNRRYLLISDNVYLSDDTHFPFISQGLSSLLDARLLPSSLNLKSLKLPGFTLQKQQSQWLFDTSSHPPETAQKMINSWQSRKASRIKPYDRSLTPMQKVVALTDNNQTIEFFVLSIKPEIIIARPDLNIQYHFPEHQYYELLSAKIAP